MSTLDCWTEPFPGLSSSLCCKSVLIGRAEGVDVHCERTEALTRLAPVHDKAISALGLADKSLWTCEQTHGKEVRQVESGATSSTRGIDGLLTADAACLLGVYVADCCAVAIVDPKTPAIALVHSGRRGTELGIVEEAIQAMEKGFGSAPAEMSAHLSPCIRPPFYEVDFAEQIAESCRRVGLSEVHDPKICTASHLERYYSYRQEKGRTGRMLALLWLKAREQA